MNTQVATISDRRSLLADMAHRYGMEPKIFADTLRATVIPQQTSNEEFAAFLMVAKEYNLNPVLKEIYAFPKRDGGIQPIVGVDGWLRLINSHPAFDGLEFDDHLDKDGAITSITARLWRKDRAKPIVVTEYMAECVRPTDPWKRWPRRMLRHKALIQCARYAFGFAGIVDPDEAERMGINVSPARTVAEPRTVTTPEDKGPPPPPSRPTQNKAVEANKSEALEAIAEDDDLDIRNQAFVKVLREDKVDEFAHWRSDALGALSGCEAQDELEATYNDLILPAKGKVFPGDWAAVMDEYHQTFDRLQMES